MIVLKQLIKYTNAPVIEATWVERTVTPAVGAEGEEGYQPESVTEVIIKCQTYGNAEMDQLAAELGDDAPQYQDLMDEVAATFTPPPATPAAQVWESIKAVRDSKTQQGGYKVGTDWFHSDTFSRGQQLGLARKADKVEQAGGDMNVPFPGNGPGGIMVWKTMTGTFVAMTPALAQAIFDAAEAQDGALFGYAEQLRAQAFNMEAQGQDPGTLDINAGWPATFQG